MFFSATPFVAYRLCTEESIKDVDPRSPSTTGGVICDLFFSSVKDMLAFLVCRKHHFQTICFSLQETPPSRDQHFLLIWFSQAVEVERCPRAPMVTRCHKIEFKTYSKDSRKKSVLGDTALRSIQPRKGTRSRSKSPKSNVVV